MAVRSYRWLLISLAVLGLAADQAGKYGVFRWLYNDGQGGSHVIVPGWFELIAQFDPTTPVCDCAVKSKLQTWSAPMMPRVNHGALWGIGGGQKGTANGFFAGVSALAAVSILVWGLRRGPAGERWLSAALGLILGGTIGNLYDRLVFGGVRDFLHFTYVEFPVFNIADSCLVVGACLLLLQALFVPPPTAAEQPTPTEGEPSAPAGEKS